MGNICNKFYGHRHKIHVYIQKYIRDKVITNCYEKWLTATYNSLRKKKQDMQLSSIHKKCTPKWDSDSLTRIMKSTRETDTCALREGQTGTW